MPAPVSHLAYGELYLRSRPELDGAVFLRGTVFPDIRYLGTIDRAQTHRVGVKLAEVAVETNAWRAGWLLHSWLDERWSGFFVEAGFMTRAENEQPRWQALKLMEADMSRTRLSDPGDVVEVLAGVDDEALEFGVKDTDVRRWGEMVGRQVLAAPTMESKQHLMRELKLDDARIVAVERAARELELEGGWGERLQECWRAIEAEFEL